MRFRRVSISREQDAAMCRKVNVIKLRSLKFCYQVPLLFKEGTMKNDAKHVFHRGWLMIVMAFLQLSIKLANTAKSVCCGLV
jgi:hypothetical protein